MRPSDSGIPGQPAPHHARRAPRRRAAAQTRGHAQRPEAAATSLMNPTGDRPGSRRHAGASANTQFHRRRRAHRAKARVRVLATGLGAMTLALLVALAGPPPIGRATTLVLVALLLVAVLPLALRQRATPWWITNWRRGAAGERHAARILGRLGRHGYWLLNDLQVPGSKANLDHLLIGPTGVFYVDAKQWKGTLRLGRDGRLWHNGRSCAKRLETVRWEAQQAQDALVDLDVRVRPVVVIFDAALPAREFMVDGIMIVRPSSLRQVIRSAPTVYGDATAAAIAQRARTVFAQAG